MGGEGGEGGREGGKEGRKKAMKGEGERKKEEAVWEEARG